MKNSLLFGLLCSPVGIGVGIILRINDWGIASGDGYGLGFISSAGIAAFLAPCFIWYIMIERRKRISVSRGITVGVLGAALAHFICWYLFLISSYIEHLYLGESTEKVVGPLGGILAALTYSLVSLPLFSLLTLPIGGLIGGICGRIFKKEESV
ncbi:uncharacterized protein METZ01_LOCUS225097 [marine metagenome]|uniref:Uncharacterized protein n=1 Tax=marine metagenome TaxID=408172 RepID=A0A382GCC1_9ZZZZ